MALRKQCLDFSNCFLGKVIGTEAFALPQPLKTHTAAWLTADFSGFNSQTVILTWVYAVQACGTEKNQLRRSVDRTSRHRRSYYARHSCVSPAVSLNNLWTGKQK